MRLYTGASLAKALRCDITTEEIWEDTKKNKGKSQILSNSFFATLWRKIKPGKIFMVRLKNDHGFIIMAENEEDACIKGAPSLLEWSHRSRSCHCHNPSYNKDCPECVKLFDECAEMLNSAHVKWLGWGRPDWNWHMHF